MAFVFRAERKLIQNTNEIFDVGPGEYDQSKTFSNNNSASNVDYLKTQKNEHPFGSSTSKDEGSCLINPNDNPGPGTYDRDEKNLSYYNMLKKTQEKKKDLNLFTAVENNIIPPSLGKILKLNQKIAFNTRGLRFRNNNYSNTSDNPGPGSYNVVSSEDLRLKNRKKTKIKFNSFVTTGSMYRKTTIPGKENFGYDDIDEHVQIMIPDPNKAIKSSGEKNDKVGPGSYDLNLSWDKNVLIWQKDSSASNTNIANSSTNNTSLSISTNKKTKKTLSKNPYKNLVKTYRNKMSPSKKNDPIDFIFDSPPGPGYYTQELSNNNFIKKVSKSQLQCFDSTTPRFQQIKDNKFSNIGPGSYYLLNSPKIVNKPQYKKGHLLDYDKVKNKNFVSGVDAYLMKIDTKNDLGPGTYDVNKTWLRKKVSNLQNFGSQEKRFVYKDDEMPGPGYYLNSDNNINEDDEFDNNNKSKNIVDNSTNEILKKYQNEKFSVPGVGTYNPNIVLSLNYKVKSNVNPFVNKKKVGFSSQEKRFENNDKKIGNNDNHILGPGLYYNEKPKSFKQNVVPFNQGNRRFSLKKDDFPLLGPGSYELSNLNDWNKKSHNILFI